MNALYQKLLRSWEVFKRSVLVIGEHPKLLVFPIVTSVLTAGIALFFLAPVGLALAAPHWIDGTRIQALAQSVGSFGSKHGGSFNFQMNPVGTAILAGIYLLDMFLATMASVAFTSQILQALRGQPVSVRRGLQIALSRWKSVLVWSLFAGLVGLVIRTLEERLAFIGRLVAGVIGLAWSIASIFAVPILVLEPSVASPLAILSRSADTIKRTWGEMLAGYIGMRGSNLLVLWASLLFWGAAGLTAYQLGNAWVLLLAGLPWLVAIVCYSYLASVTGRVYLCALYLYASEGTVPNAYDPAMMSMAWKLKKQES